MRYYLLAFLFPLSLQAEFLQFLNGDRLEGEPLGLSGENLAWHAEVFSNTLEAPLNELDKILISEEDHAPDLGIEGVTVTMNRGDLYYGTFKGIDAETLKIDTTWAGELTLRRSMIQRMDFNQDERYFLEGVGDIAEWSTVNSRKKWLQSKNGIGVRGRGAVCREVEADALFSASFKVKMQDSPRVRLLFLATQGMVYEPESYLEFIIQRQNFLARSRSIGEVEDIGQLNNLEQLEELPLAEFALYFNLKKNLMAVYLQGERVAKWSLPEGVELGEWLYLYSEYDGEVVIEDFIMKSWNGSLPVAPSKNSAYLSESENPVLHLQNGDLIDAEISGITAGKLSAKTEMGDISIPLQKVSKIDYQRTAYDEPKREQKDVTVQLMDGSRATFKLEDWNKEHIAGSCTQFGNIQIPLNNIHSVEMNIYRD